jgi:alanyl-tRNA synthetase
MRLIADRFRQQIPENGIIVLATVIDGAPRLIAGVTEDLVKEGLKAGDLIKFAAEQVGGGGGGRPTLAEAGGKDPEKLVDAIDSIPDWIKTKAT